MNVYFLPPSLQDEEWSEVRHMLEDSLRDNGPETSLVIEMSRACNQYCQVLCLDHCRFEFLKLQVCIFLLLSLLFPAVGLCTRMCVFGRPLHEPPWCHEDKECSWTHACREHRILSLPCFSLCTRVILFRGGGLALQSMRNLYDGPVNKPLDPDPSCAERAWKEQPYDIRNQV